MLMSETKVEPKAETVVPTEAKLKGKKVAKATAPAAPKLPPGTPTPEQITEFTKSLDKRMKDALNHPEFILGLNDPNVARKTKYLHEGSVDELLGELMERVEAQEFMVITIGREKNRKGAITTNFGFNMTNWAPAARAARLKKAAALAENQYLQSNDI